MVDMPATGGSFIRDPATGALTPAPVDDAPIAPVAEPVQPAPAPTVSDVPTPAAPAAKS